MSYQVFAQKYRPQTFDEVVGQDAVTRTLKNSIDQGRVANAYIFCGPRGVGKTTVARILSKTLNCEKPSKGNPCNKCDSCREISQSISMDVLEIDGASNRGIDEIRTLRENVKFSPSRGKFKIYIIDEVHMLTTEAFNALLKTLEEPPSHVKFIFATTEPHKVISTIMSRCQRFDFKKIPPRSIYRKTMDVAKKEKIDIDDKAVLLMSRASDGSLRDSLVILDQVVSFSSKKVTMDDIVELLGMVHKDKIFELADAVIRNDAKKVMSLVDEMINNGKDPVFITDSLIGHFRDLMIMKTVGAPTSDMAFNEDELEKINAQARELSGEEVLYVLQNLSHCITLMKGTMFSRAPLEIMLLKLTKRQKIMALPDILARLENMEKGCGNSGDPKSGALETPGNGSFPAPGSPAARGRAPSAKKNIKRDPIEDTDDEGPGSMDFNAEKFQWKAILNHVREKKMSIFMFLKAGRPIEITGERVVIGFKKENSFYKETLEAGENRKVIEDAINKITGSSPRVEFTFPEFLAGDPEKETGASEKEEKTTENAGEIKPQIEKAMDIFGGHIIRDLPEERK